MGTMSSGLDREILAFIDTSVILYKTLVLLKTQLKPRIPEYRGSQADGLKGVVS